MKRTTESQIKAMVESNTKTVAEIIDKLTAKIHSLEALNTELLEAMELAKNELVFLHAQDQNSKFWTQQAESAMGKINSAINKAKAQ